MTEYPKITGIEIDGELGHGAHSVVYRGRQNKSLCAVKLPRVKARWTRWIYREAVSLARVKHPGLPEVLEVGEIDGLPYLVMELVEGRTLAEKLASGPLEEDDAIFIARELASVLSAVHDAGLVHRDVKPRNVIVTEGTNRLKLVDFGFATPMERVGTPDTAGTVAYAAPEQLTPPGHVDARTDLYGLGRVLLECLIGHTKLIESVDGLWGANARSALVTRGVTPRLADVIADLLQKSPDDRYPHARALLGDLDRLNSALPPLGPSGYERVTTHARFVARDVEVGRIVTTTDELRHRAGSITIIRGERGSGKSRLLEVARDRTGYLATTLLTRCRQDDAPLATLRRLLEAYCDHEALRKAQGTSSYDAGVLRTTIGNLAAVAQLIAPQRMGRLLQANAYSASSEGAAAESLVEGAAEILLRLARRDALLIAVDDAHWMDPASADALNRVAHRIIEAPINLVFAFRSDVATTLQQRFATSRPDRVVNIELPRLGEGETRQVTAAHLGVSAPALDEALIKRIHMMADGTPLGILEVLGALLDAGALRPHERSWRYDAARVDAAILPRGALVLLGRRIAELPEAARRVLEMAAVIGTSFEEELLANAMELTLDDLGYALATARRAGLITVEELGQHRFAHDSVRELLHDELADEVRQRLHQRIAESLDGRKELAFEDLCAAAIHYVLADNPASASQTFRLARGAGEAALSRFDNAFALRFFGYAEKAAARANIRLDSDFHRQLGEAHLRLGSLAESLKSFEQALVTEQCQQRRASLFGRLSWVYQTQAEPEKAWEMLERAFLALDARLPTENAGSAAATSLHVARSTVGRLLARPMKMSSDKIDLLCELHYQNARLGMEYGKPARVLQSSLEALSLSERGGSKGVRARARAFYALVLTALGQSEMALKQSALAREIGTRDGDAATTAFCIQLESVAASWAGDIDHALILFRECVDVHGPWLELNEYFQAVATGDLIQTLRGRATDAWPWIERAMDRLRRTPTRPVVAEFLIHRARAALAALGRDDQEDEWLAKQLASVPPTNPGRNFHRLISWSPRARYYLERGDLNGEFEQLVTAFNAEGHNPKTVHLAVSEYYVAVAHARIHQCLRATQADLKRKVAALEQATKDLRGSAKVPMLKAHASLAEGCVFWFEGNERAAKKRLAEAEAIANQQNCPWVLYGVARMRAHMLRAAGKEEAARDQAHSAEAYARNHGAVTRARWVREEFGLEPPALPTRSTASLSSRGSSTSRANRQLTALLHVVRAPRRDLRIDQQAEVILDELLSSLEANRAAIWFQPEAGAAVGVIRARESDASLSLSPESARGGLLREVYRSGVAWPVLTIDNTPAASDDRQFDPQRVLVVPLFLYEKPVGALSVERGHSSSPISADDRNLLTLLSHQVPIALEIARLLAEREQLHASLLHAKKMEAMGALAGGLAHDFNNMLAAMRVALNAAQERAALDAELTVELDIISEATTRAAQLTSQLLSFSRHQPVPVKVHDVNQLISTLEPMLRRVVGSKVNVGVNLSPAVDAVEVDQNSFDQALVNLLINARDAMPEGGRLTITTKNVIMNDTAAQRANLPPGEYVEIEVADTGEGMSAETLTRIFEPFFTTKAIGKGSGLGLAMVYAFTRNCGGSIEVSSEVGRGTQFRLYLKRVARTSARHGVARSTTSSSPLNVVPTATPSSTSVKLDGPDTILIVDDDDLVRRSIAKILERNGYRVLAASGSAEALTVAREQGSRIALVILDVLMPGLTGPELGRRLFEFNNLSAKMLFVSGFSPESIPFEQAQVAAEMLLQKPFSQTTLLERVRQLMSREASS